MPYYRRARTPGGTYFFTVVTYRRRPILCLDASIKAMRDVVRSVMQTHPFRIDAWVTLPDHMHCLWTLPEGDTNYSVRWALIKKEFTRQITPFPRYDSDRTHSRERRHEGTIWQRRFWEHEIRDEADYETHMDYIHSNPVKHGLVTSPVDWPHSTFHRCVAEGLYDESWGGSDVKLPGDIGRE